jgi:hypothetical protein
MAPRWVEALALAKAPTLRPIHERKVHLLVESSSLITRYSTLSTPPFTCIPEKVLINRFYRNKIYYTNALLSLVWSVEEQLLGRNVERFRGWLVFKAHRLLYHSTLGSRITKRNKSEKRRFPQLYESIALATTKFTTQTLFFYLYGPFV